jgi:hypothetical protein
MVEYQAAGSEKFSPDSGLHKTYAEATVDKDQSRVQAEWASPGDKRQEMLSRQEHGVPLELAK